MSNSVKKVLVVDDEPNIVKAISFLLKEKGFEIYTAYDGQTGYEMAIQNLPDVIILDVMMPGMDGYSVAKKIRLHPDLNHASIVFLTAKGTGADKMSGYDSGAELYMVKPFDNDDLIQKITDLIY